MYLFFIVYIFTVSIITKVYGDTYPMCGDCWCIPAENGTAPCPKYWQPQTEFSSASINTYLKQIPNEIYTLNCNPYKDSTCMTAPMQDYLDSDAAVCGYVYNNLEDGSKSCSQYSMVTYNNRSDLMKAGAIITHEGSCGLCSTTQDLAIYLSKNIYYYLLIKSISTTNISNFILICSYYI